MLFFGHFWHFEVHKFHQKVTVLTLVSISASLKLLKIKIYKKFVQELLKNKILKLAPQKHNFWSFTGI